MAVRFQKPPIQIFSNPGLLLFVLPLPVLLAAILALARGDNLTYLIGGASGYALFLGGALLVRRGSRNQAEYERRKIARPPKPLKFLGSALTAVATTVTSLFVGGYNPAIAACFGLGAWLGCYLYYGFDPRVAKLATDKLGLDATEQVLQTLENAEKTIAALESAKKDIGNMELRARLERIIAQARQVIKVLEEDPRDLWRARKFLTVYLEGAQQVTEGYVRTHQKVQSQELENNFRTVLTTIEDVFKEQQQKLLESDVLDLDIKIEVLSQQLKREGVI